MSDHIGEPFPRDSLIDHLSSTPGWNLQSVVVYEEKDKDLALWSATFDVANGLGTVTVSEMAHKWAIDGKDPIFTLYGLSFWKRGKALGNQFLTTKNSDDFVAVTKARLGY